MKSDKNYYDNIIASHSVEHVPDAIELFKAFYYALKIGGTLAIEVPNGDSLALKKFGRYYYYLGMPLHIHLFTINSLKLLGKKVGFKNIKFSSYSSLNTQIASLDLIYKNL